jgi:hypothetical protein
VLSPKRAIRIRRCQGADAQMLVIDPSATAKSRPSSSNDDFDYRQTGQAPSTH